MGRLTAQHTACVCRAAGSAVLPFALSCHFLVSVCKSVIYVIHCYTRLLAISFPQLGHLQDAFPLVWSFMFDPTLNR